ncbi:MAG: ABC transporter permease [Nitrospiraceae bacterium]|jgi:phospholipid/cholesterol/gamma-HCH transport system permease protein|nr:ABC transporter permease [Nitrospiraceae bacterium]
MTDTQIPASLQIVPAAPDTATIVLSGEWTYTHPIPDSASVAAACKAQTSCKTILFETSGLIKWDSALLAFLMNVDAAAREAALTVDRSGLPDGVRKLMTLASAIPERTGVRRADIRLPFVARVGDTAQTVWRDTVDTVTFIGEAVQSFSRFVRGKARFRRSDLLLIMQECGAQALPIVSLISLLVGLILAYVGAIQLRMFGAQIYVADLVGIGMVRALAAIMTGIIIAGRTGASFAAQLGTMQVNEEIDALQTLGIPPIDFLVLPRMVALSIMMPLLCLYADLMGVVGGLFVGVVVLGLNPMQYLIQTQGAITTNDLWVGLFSSGVFGVLVALAGCLRGMQCGRSASAVGAATTSAVVTSIISIIIATAVITIVADILGI